MVISHTSGGRTAQLRKLTKQMLTLFGTTFTLTSRTETYNADERVTGITTADTVVLADLQLITARDTDILASGTAVIGDGILYLPHTVTAEEHYYITDSSSRIWVLQSKVEEIGIEGSVDYQAWIVRRQPQ